MKVVNESSSRIIANNALMMAETIPKPSLAQYIVTRGFTVFQPSQTIFRIYIKKLRNYKIVSVADA
jgi:hypothetical protein